ncbi:hypothetical protein KSF73_02940 [Burkholderiaceae bacterium DAT-1]|nr:hypothetical protein [Burkholderiaceae bacterium DAT-1]
MLRQAGGGSTTFIALLVAVGTVATVYQVGGALRGYQDSGVALHAVTQAQALAWRGADSLKTMLINQYCGVTAGTCAATDSNLGVPAYASGKTVEISGLSVNASDSARAFIVSNTAPSGSNPRQIVVNVTGLSAGATSTVQLVLQPYPGMPPSLPYNMLVFGNASLSGGISVANTSGGKAVIGVQGNFNVAGAKFDNVEQLNVTGDLNLSGNSILNNVTANGNVTLAGSTKIANLQASGGVDTGTALDTGTGDVTISAGNVNGQISKKDFQVVNVKNEGAQTIALQERPKINPVADAGVPDFELFLDSANKNIPSIRFKGISNVADGIYPIDDKIVYANFCDGPTTWKSSCISYEASTDTWTFKIPDKANDPIIAPGVVLIRGNASFTGGTYRNSFYVTGNVVSSNADNTFIAFNNFAAKPANASTPANPCAWVTTGTKTNITPLNQCNAVGGRVMGKSVGNVVFEVGGDLILKSYSVVNGDVRIKGLLDGSTGRVELTGGLLVTGWDSKSNQAIKGNTLTMGATFILTLPPDGGTTPVPGSGGSGATINTVWVRGL